jgi:hypothetical protein
MGTGWKYDKKPQTRPKKKLSDRKRRERVQRKRLVAMGVSEESLRRKNAGEIRAMLRAAAKAGQKPA